MIKERKAVEFPVDVESVNVVVPNEETDHYIQLQGAGEGMLTNYVGENRSEAKGVGRITKKKERQPESVGVRMGRVGKSGDP